MGTIIRLKCKKCNAADLMGLSIGMMYSPDNVFVRNDGQMLRNLVGDDRIADEAMRVLDIAHIGVRDYGWDVYFCPECKCAVRKFHFQASEKDKEGNITVKYEPEYTCSICGSVLLHIPSGWGEDLRELGQKLKQHGWRCSKCDSDDICRTAQ